MRQRKPRISAKQKAHNEWIARNMLFNEKPMRELVEIARWILWIDKELANEVRIGVTTLCDAYEECKAAEAFLLKIPVSEPNTEPREQDNGPGSKTERA